MKMKNHSLNEHGIAHLGLILLLLVIIGIGGFAYTRVNSANDTKNDTTTSTSSTKSDSNENEDVKDNAAIEDANKAAEDVPAVPTQEAPDVTQ